MNHQNTYCKIIDLELLPYLSGDNGLSSNFACNFLPSSTDISNSSTGMIILRSTESNSYLPGITETLAFFSLHKHNSPPPPPPPKKKKKKKSIEVVSLVTLSKPIWFVG